LAKKRDANINIDKSLLLKKRIEEGRLRIKNQSRTCLFPGCPKKAISSHVLQAKGILKGIVDSSNHFYSIGHVPIFEMDEDNLFKVAKVGINKGYTFPGFCNDHDAKLFIDIENHPIDLRNKRNQALFTYRTVCLEFRKQEIYLEISKDLLNAHYEIEPDKHHMLFIQPAEQAVKDMMFYKTELEGHINNGKPSSFEMEIVELPEMKICFSAALSIDDPTNEFASEVDEYGRPRKDPLAVSILNYFPYQGRSYLVGAYHRQYFCNWTKTLLGDLKRGINIKKIISDILTYRLEFWGISPQLYDSIADTTKRKFISEVHAHRENFGLDIETDFNLFSEQNVKTN